MSPRAKVPEAVRLYMSKLGKTGGKLSRASLTPEQRSRAARKAAVTRWAKRGAK